jgi:TM2 domain-containing membrane protein YozV
MNQIGTSYLLWLIWLCGAAGLHRLYNRKTFTGILWLCTWGLFGIGQLIDIFLIPDMVDEYNARYAARLGRATNGVLLEPPTVEVVVKDREPIQQPLTKEQLMVKLLKAAQTRGGKLSVTQGVLDTECGFSEVETVLKEMVRTGYVTVSNDPTTGIIVYDFVEL